MVSNLKVAEQNSLKREVHNKESIKQIAAWNNRMGVCEKEAQISGMNSMKGKKEKPCIRKKEG